MTQLNSDGTTEQHVVFVSLPTGLMQKFCVLQPPGETVGDLGDAYVNNTLCGKKYESQVEEQRAYIERVTSENGKVEDGTEKKN